MRIIVIGADGSGKSAAASVLARELGCHYSETGSVLTRRLADFFAAVTQGKKEAKKMWRRTISYCKNEYRPELKALGDVLTSDRPSYLIDNVGRAKVIVGLRRKCEAQATIEKFGRENTIWVHIYRPGAIDRDFELHDWPVDFRVTNSGNPLIFLQVVRKLAKIIRHQFAR